MPDLRPDLGIFTKPAAPMGVGDLIGAQRSIQAYQKETYEFRKEMFQDAAGALATTITDPDASQEKFEALWSLPVKAIGRRQPLQGPSIIESTLLHIGYS